MGFVGGRCWNVDAEVVHQCAVLPSHLSTYEDRGTLLMNELNGQLHHPAKK